ncbi:hypothetical protein GJ744_007690 [Endocarpon pusillum]|uniref:Uncharacterized protein n=1 Tax=Endocarpon pusillum TaxID=364733 RepID=A0A8H7E7U3_9EURO|nr:hypothetical protein GJ744_007690 [Endocarpon pusillum]
MRLKKLEQRPNQVVREVVRVIEELEKDVPSLTKDEEKAEVLRENKTITSREQVIAAAQRQEELTHRNKSSDKGQDKGKSNSDQSTSPSKAHARKNHPYRGRSSGNHGKSSADNRDHP